MKVEWTPCKGVETAAKAHQHDAFMKVRAVQSRAVDPGSDEMFSDMSRCDVNEKEVDVMRYMIAGLMCVALGLCACERKDSVEPGPQLTWQQFAKDPAALQPLITPGVSLVCMDGGSLIHEPGQPTAFVSPCMYDSPGGMPPHGYMITAAQFSPDGSPYTIVVKFDPPVATKSVPTELGVGGLEVIDTVEQEPVHGYVAYARWFSPQAVKGGVWLIEGSLSKETPDMVSEVRLTLNPFEDISMTRKLMIQHGFALIDPAHVPARSWHPGLKEQGRYALTMQSGVRGLMLNGQPVMPASQDLMGDDERARFTQIIKEGLARQKSLAKILKQPESLAMHVDVKQSTHTRQVIDVARQALSQGVSSVDVSVGVLPEGKSDYVMDGRTHQRALPTLYTSMGEALARFDSNIAPHIELVVTRYGVMWQLHDVEGAPEGMQRVSATCPEAGLCLEAMPSSDERPNVDLTTRLDALGALRGEERARAMVQALEIYDPHALNEAARRIHVAHPEVEEIFFRVEGDLPWQVVMGVMDVVNLNLKAPGVPWDWSRVQRTDDAIRFTQVGMMEMKDDE